MVTKRVKFTFPQELIKEPVIYKLGVDFGIEVVQEYIDQKEGGTSIYTPA